MAAAEAAAEAEERSRRSEEELAAMEAEAAAAVAAARRQVALPQVLGPNPDAAARMEVSSELSLAFGGADSASGSYPLGE